MRRTESPLWPLLGALLLALSALLFVETTSTIIGYLTHCECTTDSDCMQRCGGDGSPDVEVR